MPCRVAAVVQRHGADVRLVRQQAHDPVHTGGDEPALQLGQHRAADAALPPSRRQADAQQRGPRPGDGGDNRADQLVAHDGHYRRCSAADGGNQIRYAENRGRAAGHRIVPEADSSVQIVVVQVANAPGRHQPSVSTRPGALTAPRLACARPGSAPGREGPRSPESHAAVRHIVTVSGQQIRRIHPPDALKVSQGDRSAAPQPPRGGMPANFGLNYPRQKRTAAWPPSRIYLAPVPSQPWTI